jgi:hypothetical protein
MIEVAEWIMVACPGSASKGEEQLRYDRAVPGGGSAATADEVLVGPDPSASDAIVISLRPGTNAKPLFFYRPVNHPDWARTEGIPFSLSDSASSFIDRSLPEVVEETDRDMGPCAKFAPVPLASQATSASASAPPNDAGAPAEPVDIPDVDGQPPFPADDIWAAEKEVLVTGSDSLGCKTKVKDSWFWARCSGKGTISSVKVESGKHKTQTRAEVVDGELRVQTPYVEGTSFRARISGGSTDHFMNVTWAKGKRPFEVGRITD